MQKISTFLNIAFIALIVSGCAGKSGSATGCIDESKIDNNVICTTLYDPVCGCDNKTYGNECDARRNGVTSFTKGECK